MGTSRQGKGGRERGGGFLARVAGALGGWPAGPEAADCERTPAVLAAAAGELGPGAGDEAREHAAACPVCLGAFVAARRALARGAEPGPPQRSLAAAAARAAGPAAARPALEAWEASFGRVRLRYDSAGALRHDVVRTGSGVEIPEAGPWAAGPDWEGALLAARMPPPLEADSRPGPHGTALLVRLRAGRVRAITRLPLRVTHRAGDERGLAVSGRLPGEVVPVARAVEARCAWLEPGGRLWYPKEFALDRDEGLFLARFPPGAGGRGELRMLLLEPGD